MGFRSGLHVQYRSLAFGGCVQSIYIFPFGFQARASRAIQVIGHSRVILVRSEGVSNPSTPSLEDFIFCCLLLGPFPELSVADGFRPSDPKDSSKAGVDECLDLLQCCSHGSPCFISIQQDRFYCGVKDHDFDADGQVR